VIRAALKLCLGLSVSACGSDEPVGAQPFTLYRNSPIELAVRVHWATFDATESDPNYNRNNCEMAARLLNANVDASSAAEGKERHDGVGFWCEAGRYSEDGTVPSSFHSAFPTDV
jgi:hypothetical protein